MPFGPPVGPVDSGPKTHHDVKLRAVFFYYYYDCSGIEVLINISFSFCFKHGRSSGDTTKSTR